MIDDDNNNQPQTDSSVEDPQNTTGEITDVDDKNIANDRDSGQGNDVGSSE